MLNLPLLTRAFAGLLLALGLYLATENTLISADVFQASTGSSLVTAFAIAVVATGLELTFASWLRQDKTTSTVVSEIKNNPSKVLPRLFVAGLGLALVYHFDLLTTARHPAFAASESYFFGVLVLALVFGPEACIVISSWLWMKARDVESRQLDTNTTRDAENRRLRKRKEMLVALADEAGEAEAIATAQKRWGRGTENSIL